MQSSTDVIVVGGGVAGLAAATRLAELGVRAVVLEASPLAGGRARSWVDPDTGSVVDNGQHLLMACYRHTLAFLERIGARDRIAFQDHLHIDFVDAAMGRETLDCPPLPGSLSLLSGLATYRGLTMSDRLGLLALVREVKTATDGRSGVEGAPAAADESADVYLQRWGQSESARRRFWDPLIFATLNEDPRIASALTLRNVLRIALLGGSEAARLGWPRVGLGDLYAPPSAVYLASRGSGMRTSSPVARLDVFADTVTVTLRSGESLQARASVLAVPPAALARIAPDLAASAALRGSQALTCSPIVGVNLWLDRDITDLPFAGLLGTHMHWLFNKDVLLDPLGHRTDRNDRNDRNDDGSKEARAGPRRYGAYLALVASGARTLVENSTEALIVTALADLKDTFPRARTANVVHATVVKEREATISPAVGWEALRPCTRFGERRVALAGDWTATGLPATIESAAMSGHLAAEALAADL